MTAREEGRIRSYIRITAALLAPALCAAGCTHRDAHRAVKPAEPPREVEPASRTAPETLGEAEPSAPALRGARQEATPAAAAATEARGEVEPGSMAGVDGRGPLAAIQDEPSEPAPAPRVAAALPFTHSVRWKGETLSLVAWWYTGAASNWAALARANPSLNPHRIKPGDKILIPAEILRHRRQLPYERVHPPAGRGSAESASPKQPSAPAPQPVPEGIRKPEPPSGRPGEIGGLTPPTTQRPSTTPDDVKLFGPRE